VRLAWLVAALGVVACKKAAVSPEEPRRDGVLVVPPDASSPADAAAPLPPQPARAPQSRRDVRLAVSAATPTVQAGGTLRIEVRITSETDDRLDIAVAVPTSYQLEVRDASGGVVAPPPGRPEVREERRCNAVDCTAPSELDARAVVLDPRQSRTFAFDWKADRLAWPRGPIVVGCCSSHDVSPIDVGALPPGTYVLRYTLPLGSTDAPSASTTVRVTP
jgi:hypothetical protein